MSDKYQVDLSGNAYIQDEFGVSAFLTWSFQSKYRCELEIVGTEGVIRSNKIFSPRADEEVEVTLHSTTGELVDSGKFVCDHFAKLIEDLKRSIENKTNSHHEQIIKQSNWQHYVSTSSFRTIIK
jgi:predicted dehydrogenase